MKSSTLRAVAAWLIFFFMIAIFGATLTIGIIVVNKDREKNSTETTATTTVETITDIVEATIEVERASTTDATTEEIKVTQSDVSKYNVEKILNNRRVVKPKEKYKTEYPDDNFYAIQTKDDIVDKYIIKYAHNDLSIYWTAEKLVKTEPMYLAVDNSLYLIPNYETEEGREEVEKGAPVERVAVSDNGWDIVKYDTVLYFVWYADLSYVKPAEEVAKIQVEEVPMPAATTTETPVTTEVIVETTIENNTTAEVPVETTEVLTEEAVTEAPASTAAYNPWDLYVNPRAFNGYTWTWYTEVLLPGEGLPIPGRYTDGDGFVCDENGYIVLAAHLSQVARGTIMDTPFGRLGKVYDTGCNYNVIDVYTNWQPY